MTGLFMLTKRNCKLFFKDKGMFFTSLITPGILLILYATFLAKVFRDSFTASIPAGFEVSERLIGALVGGQLVSSLIAVSCVTVAFCSNFLMVQDKVRGARRDLTMTPVKKSTLAISYYLGTVISTLIVCAAALVICFIYLAIVGWCLSFADVVLLFVDMILIVLFGSALSSIINVFLTSQGQISAVGTIVSAGYGFICGAYMPISSFGKTMQNIISLLPGTYGTSLVRNHALNGVFREMADSGLPDALIQGFRDSVDCNMYFFGHGVGIGTTFTVMILSVVVLIGVYVMINVLRKKGN